MNDIFAHTGLQGDFLQRGDIQSKDGGHATGSQYTGAFHQFAAFADYLKTPAVYKCPADRSIVNGQPKIRSYALNSFMNWEKPDGGGEFSFLSANHVNFRKTGDLGVARPVDLLLFVDTAPKWLCHSAFGIAMSAVY